MKLKLKGERAPRGRELLVFPCFMLFLRIEQRSAENIRLLCAQMWKGHFPTDTDILLFASLRGYQSDTLWGKANSYFLPRGRSPPLLSPSLYTSLPSSSSRCAAISGTMSHPFDTETSSRSPLCPVMAPARGRVGAGWQCPPVSCSPPCN